MNNYDTNNKYKNILFFVFCFFFGQDVEWGLRNYEKGNEFWQGLRNKPAQTINNSWIPIVISVLGNYPWFSLEWQGQSCKKIGDLKFFHKRTVSFFLGASLVTQLVKETACNAGDLGSIPGLGRCPGEGNGNPLQYSCLENPMDRGAWQATVHGVPRVRHDLVTKPPSPPSSFLPPCLPPFLLCFFSARK